MTEEFIPLSKPSFDEAEEQALLEVLRSGWITSGPQTAQFESEFAKYVGAKHAIALTSCTAAFHLCLLALNLREGDEVITTPMSWPSLANMVTSLGAHPVFVDIDYDTLNICEERIEGVVTEKTKAIVPVHFAGYPCDMSQVGAIARKYELAVIEDAAHAAGSEFDSKKVGGISELACFSFHPVKTMTTGEGGMVTTDSDRMAERINLLKFHGITRQAWAAYGSENKLEYRTEMPGFKYNFTDLQSAIGIHQLRKLDGFIKRRKELAAFYQVHLAGIEALDIPRYPDTYPYRHSWCLYPVKINKRGLDRHELLDRLKRMGIGAGIHFHSLHLQPFYQEKYSYKKEDFPVAAQVSETVFSLPLYPSMTETEQRKVVESVKKALAR
jgi:dTDP-4-amino-4,6-dideoxygalactose transaminase